MTDFVTLSCLSCGGKLEITKDVERFACAHCGQEHIVRRSGGIVYLSPIVDELKKVGIGVDKTAAELAIVRLQKEITELQSNRVKLLTLYPRPSSRPFLSLIGVALGFLIISFGFIETDIFAVLFLSGIAVIILVVFGVPFLRPNTSNWDKTTGIQVKSFDTQIASKQAELKHYQDVVSL